MNVVNPFKDEKNFVYTMKKKKELGILFIVKQSKVKDFFFVGSRPIAGTVGDTRRRPESGFSMNKNKMLQKKLGNRYRFLTLQERRIYFRR